MTIYFMALNILKLIMIICYYKWPEVMRGLMIVDGLLLFAYSLAPISEDLKLQVVALVSIIDFITNYCGDITIQFLLANITLLGVIIVSKAVVDQEIGLSIYN